MVNQQAKVLNPDSDANYLEYYNGQRNTSVVQIDKSTLNGLMDKVDSKVGSSFDFTIQLLLAVVAISTFVFSVIKYFFNLHQQNVQTALTQIQNNYDTKCSNLQKEIDDTKETIKLNQQQLIDNLNKLERSNIYEKKEMKEDYILESKRNKEYIETEIRHLQLSQTEQTNNIHQNISRLEHKLSTEYPRTSDVVNIINDSIPTSNKRAVSKRTSTKGIAKGS